MSELSKQALKVDNNTSFPNNTTNYITPSILRAFNVNVIDSLVAEETYQPFTQSVLTSIDALDAFTASLNVSFDALDAFTASAQISITALNANTQSVNNSISLLNAATSSYVTSAITASSLITASVNLNTITFTKGNGSTFAVTVDTGSGASIPAGTVSGSAQITAFGFVSGSYETTGRSIVSSSAQITALGFVSSSVTASSLVTASFNNGTRNLTFTKGDASTFSVNIPDVSGSGGVPAGTVSSSAQIVGYNIFATTGSNSFSAQQNVYGNLLVLGGNSFSIQNNPEGSGSAFSNAQLVVDTATDPTNLYSAWQAVDSNNNGLFAIGMNSYSSQEGAVPAFFLNGGGQNVTNTPILTAAPSNNNVQFWKDNNNFSGNVNVTGSLKVGGSNVVVSSQTGSFAVNTGSFATTGSNSFAGNQTITSGYELITGIIQSLNSGGLMFSSSAGQNIVRLGAGGGQQAEFFGQITAVGQISSSNYAGFGNATTYSSSVDSRIKASATTGSNTFIGKQIISGTQNGLALTGSESYIDLSGYNSHISLYSGTGSIRFYTGSADGNGTSNIDTWVNMQVNPANGALAISSFPSNNHFLDFDVAQTASVFTAPLKAMSGNLRITSGVEVTGSLSTDGSATIGNRSAQYNNLSLVTSLTNYPGNLYNTIGIDVDDSSPYNAGFYVSTYTAYGSNPAFALYGGGNGNDGSNTILLSAGNLARITKNTEITGSLSVTGSIGVQSGSYNGKAINNITPVSSSQAAVQNIVTLTASEYALITPVATTLYIVI
jgi:hypothetical protein